MLLAIDYESFYSDEYSLSKMKRTEYLNDERFKVHGAAVSLDGGPDQWITAKHLPEFFGDMGPHIDAMLCHNGLFDHGITALKYFPREVFLLDTMSMAQGAISTRFPHLSMSLGSLGRFAFPDNPGLWKQDDILQESKGVRDLPLMLEAKIGAYSCQDNKVARHLFKWLLAQDYPWEMALVDIHLTLAMGVYPQLRMDSMRAAKIHMAEVRAKQEAVEKLRIDRADLRSGEKFAQLLRAAGVEPPTKISPKTGKVAYAFAAKDEGMKELLEHDDPRVQALVEARLGEKAAQKESRAAVFARLPADLPVPLRYAAAHPGRHGGEEFNMQNLKRGDELRACVKARPGQKILVRDLSQIELRMNAWWCGETWLVDLLRAGGDPYCMLASRIFGRTITKADEDERFLGKQGELSCGYQSGEERILTTLKNLSVKGATIELARSIKTSYRSSHPAIVAMWKMLQQTALPVVAGYGEPFEHKGVRFEHGRVVLPSGRSIWYPELHVNEDGEWVYRVNKRRNKGSEWKKIFGGAFLENIIQGMSYDVFMFHGRIACSEGYRMALAVHDEQGFSVDENKAEAVNQRMAEIQTMAPAWCADIPLKGEGGYADNYLDAKH